MSNETPRFNGICLILKLVEVDTWVEDKPVQITVPQVVETHVSHAEAFRRARELGDGCMVFIGSALPE